MSSHLPNIIAKCVLHVYEPRMPSFCDLIHSRKVLVAQLDGLEVAVYPVRCRTLWQDNVSSRVAPCNQDLRQGIAARLGDLVERGVGIDLNNERKCQNMFNIDWKGSVHTFSPVEGTWFCDPSGEYASGMISCSKQN